MLINAANLRSMYTGFNTAFNTGFQNAQVHHETIAMKVRSGTAEEDYGWLAQMPKMREWLGDRIIKNLAIHSYKIKNRRFENTVSVPREQVEDDRYGVLGPVFREMGRESRVHPDELVFELLQSGFATECFDGQFFFDTDHPVKDLTGAPVSVSNMQAGAENPWFLIDASRAVKPVVLQERIPYTFQALDKDSDENVFMQDEYIYGVRARINAGFGLWQLAFGSKDVLNAANYAAARAAMMSLTGDEGRKLGVKPTHLVFGPSNEAAAMQLLNGGTRGENVSGTIIGISNEWKDTAIPVLSVLLD